MIKRPTFLELATAMIKRGFAICPVSSDGKEGLYWGQYSHPATTISIAWMLAQDYPPDSNVGIVSRRGVGNVCFHDIDGNGVLEQIEQETGHKMPETLIVQSSPKSAPWKRHYYFKQTPESVAAFQTEITGIADLSKTNSKGKHPNRYDLKGVGGGGYVLAPGSQRGQGEIYSYLHDCPIDEIASFPPWLIEWIVEDVYKYRSETAKLRSAEERKHDRAISGSGVLEEYTDKEITIALHNRATYLAPIGMRRETIERALREQMHDFMKDGKALADKWKDHIHEVAFSKHLIIGKLNKHWMGKERKERPPISVKQKPIVPKPGEIRCDPPAIYRYKIMDGEIATFDGSIHRDEVYTRLKAALLKVGLTLTKDKADNLTTGRRMKLAGYVLEGKVWVKRPGKPETGKIG